MSKDVQQQLEEIEEKFTVSNPWIHVTSEPFPQKGFLYEVTALTYDEDGELTRPYITWAFFHNGEWISCCRCYLMVIAWRKISPPYLGD